MYQQDIVVNDQVASAVWLDSWTAPARAGLLFFGDVSAARPAQKIQVARFVADWRAVWTLGRYPGQPV